MLLPSEPPGELKLNKQGDNIQPWRTLLLIWNQSVFPCPILIVAPWPAYRFLRRQVKWSGIPISWRIFQFVVIHTVKGFGVVNKAEVDVFFWNSLALLMIQWMLAIWSLVPLPFLNPAWISGNSWFTYCWSMAYRILSITLEMAIHSSAIAWKIPWTEELGRLQSMGSQRVRHDWATSLSLLVAWQNVVHWRRERQTTSVFLPWEHYEQYEKAKWQDTERGTPQVSRCPICYWRSVEK